MLNNFSNIGWPTICTLPTRCLLIDFLKKLVVSAPAVRQFSAKKAFTSDRSVSHFTFFIEVKWFFSRIFRRLDTSLKYLEYVYFHSITTKSFFIDLPILASKIVWRFGGHKTIFFETSNDVYIYFDDLEIFPRTRKIQDYRLIFHRDCHDIQFCL